MYMPKKKPQKKKLSTVNDQGFAFREDNKCFVFQKEHIIVYIYTCL